MGSMFENSPFNQNISGWCVTNIVSEPSNFSANSPLSESNKPVWGTCSLLSITSIGDSDYYYYPGNEMVWSEAQTYAEQYGGNLVSINSQEENDFITSKTNGKIWIGLTDSDEEGVWKWSDDSEYDFSNWKSGEPNNSGNGIPCRPYGEDYVEIDNTGYWNDAPEYHCDERKTRPFIIEIKNTLTPITDANIEEAVNTCLSTHPVTGLCTDSEYGSITDWDVSNVTDMSELFKDKTQFNGDISSWDVSNVSNMSNMLRETDFNQDISSWDVSSVTSMRQMFYKSPFNQNIGSWSMSNVTDMSEMFLGTINFNQDISSWNVSSVTNMFGVFSGTNHTFNQDISSWNVSNVTNMGYMFYFSSSFNQNLSSWNVSNVKNMSEMFTSSSLSVENYDNILIGWSSLSLQNGVTFHTYKNYCNGESARQIIINNYGWNIIDNGKSENCGSPTQTSKISSFLLDEINISEIGGVSNLSATIDVASLNDIMIPLELSGTASINEDYSVSFASKGTVSIYSGGNGIGSDVNQLNQPEGIAIDNNGHVYIADYNNDRIQKTDNSTQVMSTFIENISNPVDIHIDSLGNIFILENNGTVKKYDSLGAFIADVSNGTDTDAINMDIDSDGNIYTITRYGTKVWKTSSNNSTASVLFEDSEFHFPNSISVDYLGNVYVSGQNQPVRIWNKSTGTSTSLNGTGNSRAISINEEGNLLVAQDAMGIDGRNTTVKEYNLTNIDQNNYETIFSQNTIADDYYMGISAIKSSNKNLFLSISKDPSQSGTDFNNVLKDRILMVANAPNILIPAGDTSGIISFTSLLVSGANEINKTIVITPTNPYNTDPSNSLTPKTITIVHETLGVDDITDVKSSLKLHPNPAVDYIRILGLSEKANYIIYNLLGKEILRGKVLNEENIFIHDLSNGTYFIKVENAKPIKFIKK
jgi:surface protein